MALSTLDENKLSKIIAFKQTAGKVAPNNNILHDFYAPVNKSATFISEDGETVARQIRQAQKRLNEEEVKQIILAYQNGESANELARSYGCNRHAICGQLKRHGIEVSRGKIRTEEQSREIIAQYERGLTMEEIAKRASLGRTTIQRHLHKHGVKLRGRWGEK